jgi:hypothetical protein
LSNKDVVPTYSVSKKKAPSRSLFDIQRFKHLSQLSMHISSLTKLTYKATCLPMLHIQKSDADATIRRYVVRRNELGALKLDQVLPLKSVVKEEQRLSGS